VSATIPDLWPEITSGVIGPAQILRGQGPWLEKKSGSVLELDVQVEDEDGEEGNRQILVDLSAPVLGRKERILSASHARQRPYPVKVKAASFVSKAPMSVRRGIDPPPDERSAGSQAEFLHLVSEVFASQEVRGAIESLIALSNETTTVSSLPRGTETGQDGGKGTGARETPPASVKSESTDAGKGEVSGQ
jgi:hypothetical protein